MTDAASHFDRGWGDADAMTERLLRKYDNKQDKVVEDVERLARDTIKSVIDALEYNAGRLRCWLDADLSSADDLRCQLIGKLRSIASKLETD